MTIMRDFWSPAEALMNLHRQVNRLFESGRTGTQHSLAVFPSVNLADEGDNFVLTAGVPGVGPDAIELTVLDDTLSLKGTRKPTLDDAAGYTRQERGYGEFSRTIGLPEKVSAERIEATCTNGLLVVTLPKAPEARPKQIAVEVR